MGRRLSALHSTAGRLDPSRPVYPTRLWCGFSVCTDAVLIKKNHQCPRVFFYLLLSTRCSYQCKVPTGGDALGLGMPSAEWGKNSGRFLYSSQR